MKQTLQKTFLWIYCITFVIFGNIYFSYSYDYSQSIIDNETTQELDENIISKASILENYLEKYQDSINTKARSIGLKESKIISEINILLNNIQLRLKEVQNNSIIFGSEEVLFASILEDLEELNIRIKIYFEQEEILLKQRIFTKKQRYNKLVGKLSPSINTFVESISSLLLKKETLSSNEIKLGKSVLQLKVLNSELEDFSRKNFDSMENMNRSFKQIIQAIKDEIMLILPLL